MTICHLGIFPRPEMHLPASFSFESAPLDKGLETRVPQVPVKQKDAADDQQNLERGAYQWLPQGAYCGHTLPR